jgi:hypothetical protein
MADDDDDDDGSYPDTSCSRTRSYQASGIHILLGGGAELTCDQHPKFKDSLPVLLALPKSKDLPITAYREASSSGSH